jgi:hypothetical protein
MQSEWRGGRNRLASDLVEAGFRHRKRPQNRRLLARLPGLSSHRAGHVLGYQDLPKPGLPSETNPSLHPQVPVMFYHDGSSRTSSDNDDTALNPLQPHHRLRRGVRRLVDQPQIGFGGAVGLAAALLPWLERAHVEAEALGEAGAGALGAGWRDCRRRSLVPDQVRDDGWWWFAVAGGGRGC